MIASERDLNSAARHLQKSDRVMAALVAQHGVCRIQPWQVEPFTALVDSIIAQQISTKAAATICARTLKLAGRGGRYSPTKLLRVDESELRACGLSSAKAKYVQGIAQAVIDKRIDLKKLRSAEDNVVINALTELKGVGKWTAEMLMIFAYGHPDVLSLGDWGLRRGAQYAYQLSDAPNDKVFVGMAEAWRPYRSVASWYLWRAAETGLSNNSKNRN
jgi:DNA-3-methyladenine glycosylase II